MALSGKLTVDIGVCTLIVIWSCWCKGAYTYDAYLGCFYDSYNVLTLKTDLKFRVLPLGELESNSMTIGTCINHCVDYRDDIRYAGVETGTQCFCGNASADYSQSGLGSRNDEDCSTSCSGNTGQTCGGSFGIAVYNLSLIRCQLPQMHNFLNTDEYVPVKNFTRPECQPGYILMGTSLVQHVQCIFDDSITDTRWDRQLPKCTLISSSTVSTEINNLVTTTADNGHRTSSQGSDEDPVTMTAVIAGVAIGAVLVILCVCVAAVMCHRKKNHTKTTREGTTPSLQTQDNNTSDAPVYAAVNKGPSVYSTINKDANNTSSIHTTSDEESYPDGYIAPPIQSPNLQQTEQPLYSYADVKINSSNVQDVQITDHRHEDGTKDSGWVENDLYSRTEDNEEQQEGWNDNSLYATTNQ